MHRRKHRKSKNGCLQCKQRHIKCDEHHPNCSACRTSNFSCSFEDEVRPLPPRSNIALDASVPLTSASSSLVFAPGRSFSPHEMSPYPQGGDVIPGAHHALSSSSTSIFCSSGYQSSSKDSHDSAPLPEVADINILHMELLSHFLSNVASWFFMENGKQISFQSFLIPTALEHPFVMYELLALSASHLSESKPADKSSHYLEIASAYRGRALSGLNSALENLNVTNCKAALFFSHLIAIHSFRDTFASAVNGTPFSGFLRQFVESMSLLRGVNTVISPWWGALAASDMGPIMLSAHYRREAAAQRRGSEVAPLRDLVLSADISDNVRCLYLCEIKHMQVEFDYFANIDETHLNSVHLVFTWPMKASKEFLILLEEQRPEALVILSYYGVILHQSRRAWPIRDSGKFLVTAISCHLGRRWDTWLKWPQEMVTTTIPVSSLLT
ncbi:uncharacterized protein V1518DRAFT_422688 [Limtongia smithiae]|uniref:uncharacterized protein n=1 Tax=Limtongia smithiae TaxID=1125753 RepID=UPI0034CEC4A5